jgi:NAD(P)-dependent dehydrogenase (short-subunit alcohol dehydrogenase family)
MITGASRGIGAAVAKRFAAEGAQVILVARTVGGLEEVDDAIRAAGHSPATLVPADLTKPSDIAALPNALYSRFGRLDILVGNAAMLGALSPIAHSDPELWCQVVDLNLIANYRLITMLNPLLQQSDAGRVILVTAESGHRVVPYWNAYAVSKAALEMLAKLHAAETRQSRLRVNLLDPGEVLTTLRCQAFPGGDSNCLPVPDNVTEHFVQLATVDWQETGARVTALPSSPL